MRQSTYLPGLDAVRLYAALCVVVIHVLIQLANIVPSFVLTGDEAVTLFFVLSGFLITFLLIHEQQQTGTVNVGAFYTRRALRILPLYFLIVAIGYIVPNIVSDSRTLPFALTFTVPFMAAADHAPMGWLNHLWSIGVEELFYLVYPFLVGRLGVIVTCAAIIVLRLFLTVLSAGLDPHIEYLIHLYRIECMAIGGLAAWLIVQHGLAWRVLTHRVVGMLFFGIALLVNFQIIQLDTFLLSAVFAVVLVNIVRVSSQSWLEDPRIRWWGQRSYGIYMWHFLLMTIPSRLGLLNLIGAGLIVALTAVIVPISYRFYEMPFLRLKNRFGRQETLLPASD